MSSHALRKAGAGLLLACLIGSAANAQKQNTEFFDMPFEELLRVTVADVTTASKRSESSVQAPGTVVVIDRRTIRLRGYRTLTDVLRDLPGMETIEHYFSEVGTLVPVRGLVGNNKIVVLVNGMRINPPGGEYVPLRSAVSVQYAEQVEVVYGPGSTLYGQDAILAVVNILTTRSSDAHTVELEAAAGQHQAREGWMTFTRYLDENKAFRLMGHVQYVQSDLSDLDEEYPVWWRDYEAVAAPKGSGTDPSRTDEGINLFVRLESDASSLQIWHRQSRRSSSEGFSPILGYVREARWEDVTTVAEARTRTPLAEQAELESALTFSRYEIDPETRYVFPSGPTAWFLNDYKYGIGTGASLEETLHIAAGSRMDLLAGVVLSTFDITPKATIPGGADPDRDIGTQGGSFVYFTRAGDPSTRRDIVRAPTLRYETYAAYLESSMRFTKRFKGLAGVRITDDTRFGDNPVTPRGSLILKLTDEWTAKYTYAEAYVAPAPYFANAPFDNGTVLHAPNPDLEPEEARSHEVNLSYDRNGLSLGLSVYQGEQKNLLLLSEDGSIGESVIQNPVYLEDGSTRILNRTINSGESRNMGFDLYGRAHVGCLNPWFSYSYVDYEEDIAGEERGLRGISAHNARLGLTWVASSCLVVTPSLVLRSTPDNVRDGALEHELDTPWEANLYAVYQLNPHMSIFARVRNVTDNDYALGGVTGDAAPQETFSGVLGFRATL